MKALREKTAEERRSLLMGSLTLLTKSIVNGIEYDPGHSDLDDEQPIHVCIPLGEYRRAVRLLHELESAQ